MLLLVSFKFNVVLDWLNKLPYKLSPSLYSRYDPDHCKHSCGTLLLYHNNISSECRVCLGFAFVLLKSIFLINYIYVYELSIWNYQENCKLAISVHIILKNSNYGGLHGTNFFSIVPLVYLYSRFTQKLLDGIGCSFHRVV